MTYRIALVRFTPDERKYPVNCPRSDINAGEHVIVHMPNRAEKLRNAVVDEVQFLNWNCVNTIIGVESEVTYLPNQEYTVNRRPKNTSVPDTPQDVGRALLARNWRLYHPSSNVWRGVYLKTTRQRTALIASRKNGIDFQIIQGSLPHTEGRKIYISVGNGKFVRHSYYNSGVDLYQYCLDFAQAAEDLSNDCAPFFVSKGERRPKGSWERNDLKDIYDAITDGLGGSAYLSDDVWIHRSDF
ncbi:hypothetical protein GXW78_18195 [Roseomonas terrae]|uniref:Uncharacterized protein n=1 Tax=Neoroseomonas terrae TaxID=424799 RepID=A0ABS5EKR1_9PROT|nr:hypothetical protein [Neoroseomonas terrae]MBR0651607.1 hypothetical protein [Neoroseomonas terrae]